MAKKKKEQAAPAFSGATFDVEDGGLPGEYEEDQFCAPRMCARVRAQQPCSALLAHPPRTSLP
jgi:hypothetical protein